MNKRLLNYEIKQTWKLASIFVGLILVCGVIAGVWNNIYEGDYKLVGTIILFLGMICYLFMVGIMMINRYYELLFSEEGYWKMSIPVSNKTHLSVNLKVGLMWLAVAFAALLVGVYIIDASQMANDEIFGITYIFRDFLITAEVSLGKKILGEIICLVCPVIIIINLYISTLFYVSLGKWIVSKTASVQKQAIVLLVVTGAIMCKMFIISMILELDLLIGDAFRDTFLWEIIDFAMIDVLFLISSFVMYRLSQHIIEREYDL